MGTTMADSPHVAAHLPCSSRGPPMVEVPGDIDTAWAAMSFKILNIESVMSGSPSKDEGTRTESVPGSCGVNSGQDAPRSDGSDESLHRFEILVHAGDRDRRKGHCRRLHLARKLRNGVKVRSDGLHHDEVLVESGDGARSERVGRGGGRGGLVHHRLEEIEVGVERGHRRYRPRVGPLLGGDVVLLGRLGLGEVGVDGGHVERHECGGWLDDGLGLGANCLHSRHVGVERGHRRHRPRVGPLLGGDVVLLGRLGLGEVNVDGGRHERRERCGWLDLGLGLGANGLHARHVGVERGHRRSRPHVVLHLLHALGVRRILHLILVPGRETVESRVCDVGGLRRFGPGGGRH
mmetsp:Transcript_57856/g.159708  ORF Transcript_57856/g.159708 Transcript_57856/m.159708 type:complete len:349 (-) Transcript_57856:165-1211(-)